MERGSKEEGIKEREFLISLWRRNQEERPEDEMYFHYTQAIIDRLESELDILTRAENWNEHI